MNQLTAPYRIHAIMKPMSRASSLLPCRCAVWMIAVGLLPILDPVSISEAWTSPDGVIVPRHVRRTRSVESEVVPPGSSAINALISSGSEVSERSLAGNTDYAPDSLAAGYKLGVAGTWTDSLQGSLSGSSTYEILSPTTAKVDSEVFSFGYVKTGANSATLSYTDSEDIGGGVIYQERGSTELSFSSATGGTFTSFSSYVYVGFAEEEEGTITGSGSFSYSNGEGGGGGNPIGGGGGGSGGEGGGGTGAGGGGGTLAEAVDALEFTWTTGGNQRWVFQTSVTHDGVDAAASGPIRSGQESWLETSVRGPGVLRFWWKVASEEDLDYLQFYVNGTLRDRISGHVNWRQETFLLVEGIQTLRWRYLKGDGGESGEDGGWLDLVSFGPPSGPPVIVIQPISHSVVAGSRVVLSVDAFGAPPITYQWRKGSTVLEEGTNSTYTVTNVQTNDAGSYLAVVSNPSGSRMSEPAVLTVVAQDETNHIPNPTPERGDEFGAAIATLENAGIIISDPRDKGTGRAYLFSAGRSLLSTFDNPSGLEGEGFGEALAGLGKDRVIIGAPDHSLASTLEVGVAHLYSTQGTLLTTFTNPTPRASENFGIAVAAVGTDRVLIGAWGDDDTSVAGAGAAYLFATNGLLITAFTNPAPAFGDGFGRALAPLGSERVMISAPLDDGGFGAVHLFTVAGRLLTTIKNPTPQRDEGFGWSVAAVGGDRLVVGAPAYSQGGHPVGAAHLFDTNGVLLATINNPVTPSGIGTRDANFIYWFGFAVTGVGKDQLLVGAHYGSPARVFLCSSNGDLLTTITNSHRFNMGFGRALASTGDRIIIGEPDGFDSAVGIDGGVAHVYAVRDALEILDVARSGEEVTVRWRSIAGRKYRFIRAAGVPAAEWIPLPGEVTGTGGPVSMTFPIEAEETGVFLRVELVP